MLRRIILHWTAGCHTPNQSDLLHYHFVIGADGTWYRGKHPPEANIVCKKGHYAMHTLKGNTGSIGIGMCGMLGFCRPDLDYRFPLTASQVESCFYMSALLCKQYAILPVKDCVTTHMHFNRKHKIDTGKIDINFLPPYPDIGPDEMEDFIVDKVKWYFKQKD